MTFTDSVYDNIRDGCIRSARAVVPLVMQLFSPRTVLDVGCGEGWWLAAFAEYGCDVVGIDRSSTDLAIPEDRFVGFDLATDGNFDLGPFDLVVCLEVAEHLPAERAEWLVDTLCRHADTVLFSAAPPGQGGFGHINEQWPDYWVPRFERQGFSVSGALRWPLWNRVPREVEVHYVQNLFVCMKHPSDAPELFEGSASAPLPVIHPHMWRGVLGVHGTEGLWRRSSS